MERAEAGAGGASGVGVAEIIAEERARSREYGGRTVYDRDEGPRTRRG